MSARRATKVTLVVVLVAAVAAIYLSPLREYMDREQIRGFVEQLRGLWYGPVAFVLIFALACVFAVPASIFVLAAGLIWGWKLGGTYSMLGGILGAAASFAAGRFIGEGLLQRFGRVGAVVAKQVDHAGFKSLLVLRFIPGLPFAALNYGAGVCGVRFGDFVLATILGMGPSVYLFAYCDDALFNGTMTEGDAVVKLLILGGAMIAIVLIPGLLKRRMRPAADSER
jgi:uncharacterized membrane protein YdjX (TVP38/TMEM64 family)